VSSSQLLSTLGFCQACPQQECSACQASPLYGLACTECSAGFVLAGGRCVAPGCQTDGQYFNVDELQCDNCPTGCAVCRYSWAVKAPQCDAC
jgi:hypothetical protein